MTSEQAYMVRFSKLIHRELVEQEFQFEQQFYLTQTCDLACPGCYMGSSPFVPRAEIPQSHIESIIADANRFPNFSHRVCLSGGEARLIGTQKLGNVLQSVLDRGCMPELKTNGAWVAKPKLADEMYAMLGNLRVPRGRIANSQEEIDLYATRELKKLSYLDDRDTQMKIINEKLDEKFPIVPGLSVCMSVDNKIHPEKSADWFVDFADRSSAIPELANNYDIGVVTFDDSMKWFQKNVVFNKRVEFIEYYKHLDRFGFKCRDKAIVGLQQKFHDISRPINPSDMHKLTFQENTNMPRRLVLYYYPDQTASLSLYGEKIVGRVPYIKNGKIKNMNTLLNDMIQKLMSEYAQIRFGR